MKHIGCLLFALVSASAAAGDYFKPYAADGAAVRPGPCAPDKTVRGWVVRELGTGVMVEAALTRVADGEVSAALLFRSTDPGLELWAEDIGLHVFPGGRPVAASKVRKAPHRPISETCRRHGEWIHLTFQVTGEIEQLALVFADDTVQMEERNIRVRPIRFERTDEAAAEGPAPVRPPVTINVVAPEERMKSCDPAIAVAAAEEITTKRATLKEPLHFITAAIVLFAYGKKEDALFWLYAGQLRTRYQVALEGGGDRGQILAIMMMTAGEVINNHAFHDPPNLAATIDRVLEWDRKTPSPHRGKAATPSQKEQIAQVYSSLQQLKAKINAEQTELEQQARRAAFRMPDLAAERARQCANPPRKLQ